MAAFLAKRIIGGYMTYEAVPKSLKDQTAAELTALGRTDLIQAD